MDHSFDGSNISRTIEFKLNRIKYSQRREKRRGYKMTKNNRDDMTLINPRRRLSNPSSTFHPTSYCMFEVWLICHRLCTNDSKISYETKLSMMMCRIWMLSALALFLKLWANDDALAMSNMLSCHHAYPKRRRKGDSNLILIKHHQFWALVFEFLTHRKPSHYRISRNVRQSNNLHT